MKGNFPKETETGINTPGKGYNISVLIFAISSGDPCHQQGKRWEIHNATVITGTGSDRKSSTCSRFQIF